MTKGVPSARTLAVARSIGSFVIAPVTAHCNPKQSKDCTAYPLRAPPSTEMLTVTWKASRTLLLLVRAIRDDFDFFGRVVYSIKLRPLAGDTAPASGLDNKTLAIVVKRRIKPLQSHGHSRATTSLPGLWSFWHLVRENAGESESE